MRSFEAVSIALLKAVAKTKFTTNALTTATAHARNLTSRVQPYVAQAHAGAEPVTFARRMEESASDGTIAEETSTY
ncbi:hypothetical protein ANCCAN_00464 [Ancylostoma caninum]|uniref:Uncharacterized protein n=1 Tax=Ancylostoma caninum TaxID=29170 RepID=A0A368HCN0_ANCCA|nr:hypothetical protein ANCCAN_00464 [Ancylostoma caninum]